MRMPSRKAIAIAGLGIAAWLIDGGLRPLSWFGRDRHEVEPRPAAEMDACPGCGYELPAGDVWAQKAHMEDAHPEIIAERLRAAGISP